MAGDLPTRMCEGCGQLWSSARFLDPTIEVECGLCGDRLVRPGSPTSEFVHRIERAGDPLVSGEPSTNGAGAPVAPLR
jgi:ribosomal protein S27E